jgi:hypothetical protein
MRFYKHEMFKKLAIAMQFAHELWLDTLREQDDDLL